MSTLKVNAITDASGGSNAVLYGPASPDGSMGFRNRIINGDMRIDQRNAGAAVTINSTNNTYTLDRWMAAGQITDGVFTIQRSTTTPTGFTNSLLVTVTTADASIGASQIYVLSQFIEGFNTADLMWGTANAKTVTVSFWVRSSVTGTFSGALNNSDNTRSYPFTYVINSANTYEYKTVTITGDTTGTWLTDNGRGVTVRFSLGIGSTNSGTAGAWSGSTLYAATGTTNLISTLNATWYITGVQLEVGSVATPFERRPYGTELALCQRYYYRISPGDTTRMLGTGNAFSSTAGGATVYFPVTMRIRPTALEQSGTASHYQMLNAAGSGLACSAVPTFNAVTTSEIAYVTTTVASGLVSGDSSLMLTNNTAAYLGWSAEL